MHLSWALRSHSCFRAQQGQDQKTLLSQILQPSLSFHGSGSEEDVPKEPELKEAISITPRLT